MIYCSTSPNYSRQLFSGLETSYPEKKRIKIVEVKILS